MVGRMLLESVSIRARGVPNGYDCFREGSDYRLQLWGRLPPEWAGNLALNAFACGLSIVDGSAVRGAGGQWVASLRISTGGRRMPLRYDFSRMASKAPRSLPAMPEPTISIEVAPTADGPLGGFDAFVRGEDTVGLLAVVLSRFAAFGLVPHSFSLETVQGKVNDRIGFEPVEPTNPS